MEILKKSAGFIPVPSEMLVIEVSAICSAFLIKTTHSEKHAWVGVFEIILLNAIV